MRLMLNFSASVLNTPFSSRRISRRTTESRVVVLPTKVMRLTKYCSPSWRRMVTSTTAAGLPASVFGAGVAALVDVPSVFGGALGVCVAVVSALAAGASVFGAVPSVPAGAAAAGAGSPGVRGFRSG